MSDHCPTCGNFYWRCEEIGCPRFDSRSARDVLTDLAWGLWDLGLLAIGRWRHVR